MVSGSSGISGSADKIFVLQKDCRMKNTAKLICVGRDVESYEFHIEHDQETHIWKQLNPVEVQEKITPEMIKDLRDYIKSVSIFSGIASELVEEIFRFNGKEYYHSVLKKNIIKHNDFLASNSIIYTENRSFDRREFTLCYDAMTSDTHMYGEEEIV